MPDLVWAFHLDADQRAAVEAFLDAMTEHHPDVAAAHAAFSR